jgi:hypothetical protein
MHLRLFLLIFAATLMLSAPQATAKPEALPEPVKHEVLKTGNFTLFNIDLQWQKPGKYPVVRTYDKQKAFADDWSKLLAQDPTKVPEIKFGKHRAVIAVTPPRADSLTDYKLRGILSAKKGFRIDVLKTRKEGVGLTVVTAPRFWVLTIPQGKEKVYMEVVEEE